MGRSRDEIKYFISCLVDTASSDLHSGCTLPPSPFAFFRCSNGYYMMGMEMFGINNLPSSAVMKKIDEVLQLSCGIDTIWYRGLFKHTYYVNHLGSIISQFDYLSSTSREKLTVIL